MQLNTIYNTTHKTKFWPAKSFERQIRPVSRYSKKQDAPARVKRVFIRIKCESRFCLVFLSACLINFFTFVFLGEKALNVKTNSKFRGASN